MLGVSDDAVGDYLLNRYAKSYGYDAVTPRKIGYRGREVSIPAQGRYDAAPNYAMNWDTLQRNVGNEIGLSPYEAMKPKKPIKPSINNDWVPYDDNPLNMSQSATPILSKAEKPWGKDGGAIDWWQSKMEPEFLDDAVYDYTPASAAAAGMAESDKWQKSKDLLMKMPGAETPYPNKNYVSFSGPKNTLDLDSGSVKVTNNSGVKPFWKDEVWSGQTYNYSSGQPNAITPINKFMYTYAPNKNYDISVIPGYSAKVFQKPLLPNQTNQHQYLASKKEAAQQIQKAIDSANEGMELADYTLIGDVDLFKGILERIQNSMAITPPKK